ncbi:MAG: hypothetical protein VB122_03480 [Erysipelotrichales bacterium]|nr:hypothetical protein [Erysipelotrichales bacterium]
MLAIVKFVKPSILELASSKEFSTGFPTMCNFLVSFNEEYSGSYNSIDIENLKLILKKRNMIDVTNNHNLIMLLTIQY